MSLHLIVTPCTNPKLYLCPQLVCYKTIHHGNNCHFQMIKCTCDGYLMPLWHCKYGVFLFHFIFNYFHFFNFLFTIAQFLAHNHFVLTFTLINCVLCTIVLILALVVIDYLFSFEFCCHQLFTNMSLLPSVFIIINFFKFANLWT